MNELDYMGFGYVDLKNKCCERDISQSPPSLFAFSCVCTVRIRWECDDAAIRFFLLVFVLRIQYDLSLRLAMTMPVKMSDYDGGVHLHFVLSPERASTHAHI